MLASFLIAEKQAIVFGPRDCGEIVNGNQAAEWESITRAYRSQDGRLAVWAVKL
jgi:hypothetical protein